MKNLRYSLRFKIALLFVLLLFADWLFLGHAVGFTPALFGAALLAALYAVQPPRFNGKNEKTAAALMVGLLAAMVVSTGPLNIFMFSVLAAAYVLLPRLESGNLYALSRKSFRLFLTSPVKPVRDFLSAQTAQTRTKKRIRLENFATHVLLPLLLCCLFIMFFSSVNPVFANLVKDINLDFLKKLFDAERLFFWGIICIPLWAVIRPRIKINHAAPFLSARGFDNWFSPKSIAWSLIAFNIIFIVQNITEIMFLTSGASLPAGKTYAQSATSGAFTLMLAVLLSVWYVLLIFNENNRQNRTPLGTKLIYVWIAQNIILLISAVYRNWQYIDVYALTHVRLYTMIWAAVIAAGLCLMVHAIIKNRGNRWLVNVNILVVFGVLYASCFINYNSLIARYNIAVSAEMTGEGQELDISYLSSLGPSVIPVTDRFLPQMNLTPKKKVELNDIKYRFLWHHYRKKQNSNWRNWTWRQHRLHENVSYNDDLLQIVGRQWYPQEWMALPPGLEGNPDFFIRFAFLQNITVHTPCGSGHSSAVLSEDGGIKVSDTLTIFERPCAYDMDGIREIFDAFTRDLVKAETWEYREDRLFLFDKNKNILLVLSKD